MRVNTVKYPSGYREHRYEIIDDPPKKQPNICFIRKELATKVFMDCRTTAAHEFKTRLVFKQNHVILTKDQSVLTKVKSSFEGENMQTQYNMLGDRIDLYFHEYELAIEIGENGQSNGNIDYKVKKQKPIEQETEERRLLTKKTLIFLKLSMKYLVTSKNPLIS